MNLICNNVFMPERTAFIQNDATGDLIHTKKRALEKMSDLISSSVITLKYTHVLNALQQRERLGSTAIGHGVAIPHARMKEASEACCAVIVLAQPIEFSSLPVDILLGLIVPENYDEAHLHILAQISESLSKADFRAELRQTKDSEHLYRSITRSLYAKN